MNSNNNSALAFHPLRDSLFNELHTRPFPVIATPGKVSHICVLHDSTKDDFYAEEFAHLCAICARYSANPPGEDASCYYSDFGGFEFRWEKHTEFSTYTFIHHLDSLPFEKTGMSLLPEDWLNGIPGEVISGLHIDVEPMPNVMPSVESLRNFFEGHRLLSCFEGEQEAQIWTAYRIHSDNMGRILIFNNRLNACQTGRLVRRLLEMETYRMMALLSLPIAKKIAPNIRGMNLKLADIIQEIKYIKTLEDKRTLMSELTDLSAEIEHLISDTNYRFSATEAYYNLAMTRLNGLRETEVCGLQTFGEFLGRRLGPAYHTCETVEKDLDDLSRRIDRASELLRTRMNLTIESQNQKLLQSMNRRAKLQLRMQQAVEGLSVAAISYYLVGLVKYLAESAKSVGYIENTALIVGASVPIAITFVIVGLGRLKKKLKNENQELKRRCEQ